MTSRTTVKLNDDLVAELKAHKQHILETTGKNLSLSEIISHLIKGGQNCTPLGGQNNLGVQKGGQKSGHFEKSGHEGGQGVQKGVHFENFCTPVVQEGGHFVLQSDFDLEIKEIKNAYTSLKQAFSRLSNDFDDLESRVTVD